MEKKTRTLKLHSKQLRNQNGNRNVPWLNISGLWLEKAGFAIDSQVEVTTHKNKLIIKTKAS